MKQSSSVHLPKQFACPQKTTSQNVVSHLSIPDKSVDSEKTHKTIRTALKMPNFPMPQCRASKTKAQPAAGLPLQVPKAVKKNYVPCSSALVATIPASSPPHPPTLASCPMQVDAIAENWIQGVIKTARINHGHLDALAAATLLSARTCMHDGTARHGTAAAGTRSGSRLLITSLRLICWIFAVGDREVGATIHREIERGKRS